MIDRLEKLHPDIIQDFRKSGKSSAIAPDLQQYILQLDRVVEIYQFEHNISRAARKLQETFTGLTFMTARLRVYDAINVFHLNNTVKAEAWDNLYADQMEDLSRLAISADNISEARRCKERAREYRQNAANLAIDPNLIKPKIEVLSPDIDPARLGLPDKTLREIWIDTETMIDKLPIDEIAKRKARKDAALNMGFLHDIEEYEGNE